MKKKSGKKKQTDVPEFEFKEFTAEESRIYEEAVNAYRGAVSEGKNLRQAFETYTVADKDLEKLIQADFLKIMIAEHHYGQGRPMEEIAGTLGISLDLVRETHARMLQEAGMAAANEFGREFGGIIPKAND